jgi:hypothetical protein
LIKQVVHITGSETDRDLVPYMDCLIQEVIPKILQLPGVIKADITKLTNMSSPSQIVDETKVSLQAQVYYESEEAYQYIISNILDEDLMQILQDGQNCISIYSGYQYSFQKY